MRPGGRRCFALVSTLLAAALGCASALKPLPENSMLGRADPSLVDPAAARRWSLEAAAAFDRRPDIDAVREAEDLWLRAALAAPESATPILGAVRAQIWLTNHLRGDAERERQAGIAVETAQWCERRDPEESECHYQLALALGVQANERRSTAYDGLRRMVDRLERAIAEIPETDFAGPHRVLARVLVNAPGWPTGPGDPDTGLEHALRAVEMFPAYPPNLLALAEAYREVEQTVASRRTYERALRAATALRDEGTEPDATEWVDEAADALAQLRG